MPSHIHKSANLRWGLWGVAFVLIGGTLEPAARGAVLRWTFKPGESLQYTLEQKSVAIVKYPSGRETRSILSQTIDMTWTVQSVDPSGAAELTQTMTRIRDQLEGAPDSYTYDSRDGDAQEPASPLVAARLPLFQALLKASVSFRMTPRGEPSHMHVPAPLFETMAALGPAAAGVWELISEEGLKEMAARAGLADADDDTGSGTTSTTPTPPKRVALVESLHVEVDETDGGAGAARHVHPEALKTALSVPVNAPPGARRTPVAVAVARAQPSVVSIASETKAAAPSRWPFSSDEKRRPRVSGMGTGVILDGRGYILTNQHVVDQQQDLQVRLADGRSYPARVLQADPVMDLALLKIEPTQPLPAIVVGTSHDLMVGEPAITIGNAYGYENTVAVGIISALKRNVTLSDNQVYRNLIQTDAAINPGNSGGPLINIEGALIGINVAVRAEAQGIGFALPIDDVKRVAAEFMSTRRLNRTWHGLVAGEAEAHEGSSRSVVLAAVEKGSPAEAAGFHQGDQLLQVGDLSLTTPLDIERALLDLPPGRPTRVLVRRDGRQQALDLAVRSLTAAPELRPNLAATASAGERVFRILGLKTQPVAAPYVAAASPRLHGGLLVSEVARGSSGDRSLIQKGDILVGISVGRRHWETLSADNVLFILRQPEVPGAQTLTYYIVRRNVIYQGSISLGELLSSTTPGR